MGFDAGDSSIASGSEWTALGPRALARGCLPLFCFLQLAAGGLAVEAESLDDRLAGITAKRAQMGRELPNGAKSPPAYHRVPN